VSEALLRRIEELEQRVAALEDCRKGCEKYRRLGTTASEAIILELLMERESVSDNAILTAIYGLADCAPQPKITQVWACRLRKKLGLEIMRSRAGVDQEGRYSLSEPSRRRVQQLLEGIAA
jgi:hypothetical protein